VLHGLTGARITYLRKGIISILAGVVFVVTSGTVHGTALVVCQAIIAAATSTGLIAVRNGPRPGDHLGGA
jgi:hypothetical protein